MTMTEKSQKLRTSSSSNLQVAALSITHARNMKILDNANELIVIRLV